MNHSNNLSAAADARHAGEQQVVWTLWFTYGAFYFCRTNISVALPGIEAELGYDKTSMAIVLTALKIAYGCGQFLNGQLAERLSPRKMIAIGMFGSAALNVLFGFGTAMYFFLFVWACNGYAQSLGWTPCVRVSTRFRCRWIRWSAYKATSGRRRYPRPTPRSCRSS